jgi:methionyl-tRNA formyltransferase
MTIQILCDNPQSWIIPYALQLAEELKIMRNEVSLIHKHDEVKHGDILVLLSCEKLFKRLNLNKYNLVVHESALPEGKGWSPLTWQILEGKNSIPVTLIEASVEVDSGVIYGQKYINFKGTELIDEMRVLQANATIELILEFINKYPNNIGEPQLGESTYYPRRQPENSKLNINKTIIEQFNIFRVCDNERYPAWFEVDGKKFNIKIYKK